MNSFPKRVYKVVRRIPKGKVMTYGQIAKLIGCPKAYRAVGNILNKNRDKKIPCHRVVKSDGRTGGFRDGIKNKIVLLKKEGIMINSNGKIIFRATE